MGSKPLPHASEKAPGPTSGGPETLRSVLGGRGGAVDATLPVVAFVAALAIAQAAGSTATVYWAGGAAVVLALGIAAWRIAQGRKPRAVLVGLLLVTIAALVPIYTGRAVDFFLVQLASNAGSALAWAVSIVIRWPLLGVVVGTALGQRTRWRRDPDLLRGYQRAGWVWVLQYVVRLAVFVPLYLAGDVIWLGITRVALTWPLVALCVAASWPVLRGALPPGHPGIRHPVEQPSG